jgi:WD40 repeat protein
MLLDLTKTQTQLIRSKKFENLEILIKSFTPYEKAVVFLDFSEKERETIENSESIKNIIRSWAMERIKQIGSAFDTAIDKAAKSGKITELLNLGAVFETQEKTEDVLKIFHYPVVSAKNQESEKK